MTVFSVYWLRAFTITTSPFMFEVRLCERSRCCEQGHEFNAKGATEDSPAFQGGVEVQSIEEPASAGDRSTLSTKSAEEMGRP
jgi:hypothetical protein